MELQFNRKPCLILEATELLYVFVNQLSPRMLTADGPYCIPPAEVSAIMEDVCGSLSPEDPSRNTSCWSNPAPPVWPA